jgi:RimJ/RimL family protein N-acetyltransferase
MKRAAWLSDIIWAHHNDQPEIYTAMERFVSERIWGKPKEFGIGRAMAVAHNGVIIAGLIYTNYDPDCGIIEISGAADTSRWLTKPVLKAMFEFPFNELKCQAVFMTVDLENHNISSILERYGFKRYEIPRLRGRDKTGVIFMLSDDAWRSNGFHKDI